MEILLWIAGLAIFISILIPVVSFAPWVPSPQQHLRKILEIAQIKPGERFYDLGCGDGRVVLFAARHFQAKATGVELAIPVFIRATFKRIFSGASNANIEFGSLFKRNVSDADVIYVYGMPHALQKRLREKLERECKPGTRVISFMFTIGDWKPAVVESLPGKMHGQDMVVTLYVL